MSKTEELAHGFAVRQWGKSVPHTVHEYEAMLKEFCGEIMAMPLSERLNEEEKERIRCRYAEAQGWLDEKTTVDNPNEQLRLCAVAIQDRLESIFGADFFKEERE